MELFRLRLKYKGIETIYDELDIPDGLHNFDLTFTRSKKYFTVFNNYTTPFSFVFGAKRDVDNIKNTDGINAIVECAVDMRNPENLVFEEIVKGTLDFTQYHFYEDYTDIPMIDGTKKAKFIERDDINYNLNSLVSTDNITIPPMANSPLLCKYSAIAPTLWAIGYGTVAEIASGTANYFNTIYQTGDFPTNIIGNGVDASPAAGIIYTNLFSVEKALTVSFDLASFVSGFIKTSTGGTVGWFLTFQISSHDAGGTSIDDDIPYSYSENITQATSTTILYLSDNQNINTSFTSSIPPNGYIKIRTIIFFQGASGFNFEFSHNVNVDLNNLRIVEVNNPIPESQAESMFVHEIGTKLIQLSTSELDTTKLLRSEILGKTDSEFQTYAIDGKWSKLAVTNGFNLRGLSRSINCSFTDYWQSTNSIGNLGFWFDNVNNIFEIKEKKEYYKNIQIIDFGEVSDFEIVPAKDLIANKAIGGYATDNSYDIINGFLEYNGKTESSTPLIIKNSIDIRSTFNGDTIGITEARYRATEVRSGSDTFDSDKTNFIVNMERYSEGIGESIITGFITKDGSGFNSITGIVDGEQYYNLDITPKRNLIRNSSIISPSFWLLIDEYINSVSTRNSVDLKTQILSTDPIISELDNEIVNASVSRSSILAPLYDYDYYIFTSPITSPMIQQLLADPHGYCRCVSDGIEYFGFPEDISTNIFDRTGNVKLIKKPD